MSAEKDSSSLYSYSVTSTFFETDSNCITLAPSDHSSKNAAQEKSRRSFIPWKSSFWSLTKVLSGLQDLDRRGRLRKVVTLFPLENNVLALQKLDTQTCRIALEMLNSTSSLKRYQAMQVLMWQIGSGVHKGLVTCVAELPDIRMVSWFSKLSETLPPEWCVYSRTMWDISSC